MLIGNKIKALRLKKGLTIATSNLGAISEELGASAQEVAASCQTVTNILGNTASKTDDMKKINDELIESVSIFKL